MQKVQRKKMKAITPSIKVGDILKLGVTKFGKDGDPIMVHKGFIIFLKDVEKRGVELNMMIEIKIIKVFPNYAFAGRTNEIKK